MTNTTTTLELPRREQTATDATPRWIPLVVRCRSCDALAHEIDYQQISNEEVIVRFECDYCCHIQTRHYSEASLLK